MISRWILLGLLLRPASAAGPLKIVVLEGDGAINNIRLQRGRDPVVRVETPGGTPVAGAAVHFLLPSQGPGGSFADGPTATVLTDADGRATGRALRPNKTPGQFEIRVTASHEGASASARITQTNAQPVELTRSSSRKIAIFAIIGGAVAGGAVLGARSGGKSSPTALPPATSTASIVSTTVITPGSPAIGPP